jgi:homocitrate synthase NifV
VVFGLRKLYGFQVDVDLTQFPSLSKKVSTAAGRPLSWYKSLVGEGAFTHEAGIHVDGLLKHPLNYQGVDPAELGRSHRLVLGKHSGTQAVRKIYSDLGISLSRSQALAVLERVRAFVQRSKRPPEVNELKSFYQELKATHSHSVRATPTAGAGRCRGCR